MNNNNANIDDLLFLFVEDMLSPDGIDYITNWLSSEPGAVRYYCEFINDYVAMKYQLNSMIDMEGETFSVSDEYDAAVWAALADVEKTAPELTIPKEERPQELIQKVVYPAREKRKVSKFQIVTLVMSAAAILFFVLFLRYIPEQYSVEVATLVDQMNVKWSDSSIGFNNGDRLWTNQMPLCLDKGIVNIQYDDGVDVVVEGPAKFAVERSGVYVEYGRLFSRVSKSGLGFLVETPTARFVDQGTEFGVQAEVNGSAELHVIKGKVQLFAGSHEKAKSSLVVTENKAVRYNANSFKIDEIPIVANAFVRSINSKTRQVWHGETSLSLASIVAGHDGFREVDSLIGLNPDSGRYNTFTVYENLKSDGTYNPVTESGYIDGVFVPDGESGPVQVTSLGHTFDCPNTSGVFTHDIAAYKEPVQNQGITISPVIVQGEKIENNSVVLLHSNVGITIDLQAIRDALPLIDLKSVKARGGLTEALPDIKKYQPDIDFWILVDGQIRYEKKALTVEDGSISFEIELNPQDRFLSLIVTDGLREGNDREYPYGNDFFYLIDPQLCLTERLEK